MSGGRFPIKAIEGVPVITAPEEIDINNAEELRSTLLMAATNWESTVVVDMTRTQFCDVSGLRALVAAHKTAEANGHDVLLAISSTAVLRVVGLIGMDRLISTFSCLAEATGQALRLDGEPGQARQPTRRRTMPGVAPGVSPLRVPSGGPADDLPVIGATCPTTHSRAAPRE